MHNNNYTIIMKNGEYVNVIATSVVEMEDEIEVYNNEIRLGVFYKSNIAGYLVNAMIPKEPVPEPEKIEG